MGEVEKTLERLNKVLEGAVCPKVYLRGLNKDEDTWVMTIGTCLQFDKDGKYVAPEAGEYGGQSLSMDGISESFKV